jgi:uncharacterized protein YyaL (SSP411 family)
MNRLVLISVGYAACHWCELYYAESAQTEASRPLPVL